MGNRGYVTLVVRTEGFKSEGVGKGQAGFCV